MILVKRTSVVVDGYEWNRARLLESRFAVYNIVNYKEEYKGLVYDNENKLLYLPRGMDIREIEKHIRERAVVDKFYDPYDSIGKVKIKYLPKNDVQKQAIRFILGLAEYNYTLPYSQLCINLMTGKGKTYVTIASMAWEECKFIVITSINGWLQQWIEKVLEYTDFKKSEILQLNTKVIDKILNGKLNLSKYKMYTCNHKTFGEYGNKHGWDKIEDLFKLLKVKYKIFDEAHLYFDSMSMIDFHSNCYKTLYLTASPYRSDDKENMIYRTYFEFVPSIELFNKERDAKTRYVSIHFNSHPLSIQIMACMNKFGLVKPRYVEYLLTNQNFWMLIYICFNEAVLPNPGRTLLLVETNNAIPVLKSWIEKEFPEYIGKIGVFYGETKEEDRAIAKKKQIVITNRMCGGTCLDIENLGVCFPLLVPAKSKVIAHQLFGRVGREGTVLPNFLYLDIVDEGFRKLKEYYTNKLPVFMKYATDCSKVLYRDDKLYSMFNYYKDLRNRQPPIIAPWDIKIPEEKIPWSIVIPPE